MYVRIQQCFVFQMLEGGGTKKKGPDRIISGRIGSIKIGFSVGVGIISFQVQFRFFQAIRWRRKRYYLVLNSEEHTHTHFGCLSRLKLGVGALVRLTSANFSKAFQ